MDYIIIALWGLLAGGLLFSGSSSHSQKSKAPEVEANELFVSEQIEMPVNPISKPKVVLGEDMNEVSSLIEQPVAYEEVPVAHLNDRPTAPVQYTAPAKTVQKETAESETEKAASGALSFTKSKPKKEVKEKKQKAISFKKEKTAQPEIAVMQEDVPTHDTVIVFKVIPDDAPLEAPIVSAVEPVVEEAVAVQTVPAPTVQQSHKQKNVKLPKGLTIDQLLCDDSGKPKRHSLRKGESLTQIAQLYYADARFWPYVYEVNRHQLSSPDKVQADMLLYLPDPQYYDIDGGSVESVNKARNLVAKYTK